MPVIPGVSIYDGSGNPAVILANGALLTATTDDTSPVGASATGIAAASVVATLPATPGVTNYISGFSVSSAAATAVVSGTVTVAGIVGGSQVYQYSETVTGSVLTVNFTNPIPATAVNTAITVTLSAIIGGAASSVNVWGYQR
jgi:predicted CDP-diglyceride synthetase/phosphatidate cytidylyltransferase